MEITETKIKCPQIVEYDVLRVIVTLLVILGHCVYYGGFDISYWLLPKESTFYHGFLHCIVLPIYCFHMPLYMALSGALFCLQGGGTAL